MNTTSESESGVAALEDEQQAPASMRRRVAQLERQLAERDREALLNQQQMSAVYSYLLGLYEVVPGALVTISPNGEITRTNRSFHALLGIPEGSRITRSLERYWPDARDFIARCLADPAALHRVEAQWVKRDGEHLPLLISAACQRDGDGGVLSILCVGLDLRERRQLEVELRHAQKLEALGQLAAGIAHEINTPMQFVGDNLHFIRDAFAAVMKLVDAATRHASGELPSRTEFDNALAEADLGYLRERVPRAIGRSIDGVMRVAGIVEAMKRFSHPRAELSEIDVNRALSDALTVANNEYKYVADVVTEFGELPPVIANGSDLNQVFLNLLVNAAHAIDARGDGQRGRITVTTAVQGHNIIVTIADTGTGIPEAIQQRVFDPFFTTKEVGKGTGQGLAISRSIVVDRHGGSLDFTTEPGVGTAFQITLPIVGPPIRAVRVFGMASP